MSGAGDDELLQRMASGDAGAFTALYRKLQGGIYRFALHMSGSEALAEDVVQEVFLALMRDPRAYDPKRGSVAAFLCGIARNHVLRRLEQPGRNGEIDEEQPAAGHPEDGLARSEMIASVRAAVLALPAHYREVVVLCDLEEAPYEEAAAALGCAVGTVRSRLHRARQFLAKRLQAYGAGCSK
jgi:RNA polymerase sigma-70 factor (ECF subfamily)